jgi:hypothetical protein
MSMLSLQEKKDNILSDTMLSDHIILSLHNIMLSDNMLTDNTKLSAVNML